MADKVDLKKQERGYFTALTKGWEEIFLPPFPYLMVDGRGPPGGQDYTAALSALYPAAYALKFFSKQELGRDYAVPVLEGLWWSDRLDAYADDRREEWCWTLMLMVPRWITAEHLAQALARKAATRRQAADLSAVRQAMLDEGRCLQHFHLGPFAAEAPKLAELHKQIMPARGLTFAGHHHEIYLSDPRRTAPEKLRTILRQPVRSA
ncbi:GyrI-like domain-containing protein [Alteraurantiacibacter palmitatis]|uniref:GyrI-like domain-containing protein n=1 Tax=Alteraurantiacibacter palmitatis TaxID=2054628 RepID=A0ABV7E2M4_9SPHN